MRRMHKYYTKLFFVILLTVMIASAVIAGIIIVRGVGNIQTIESNSLSSSAEQKAKMYEVNISNLHSLSRSIANDTETRQYFINLKAGKQNKEQFQNIKQDLEAEMADHPELLENAFFVVDGICYIDGLGGTSVGFDIEKENAEWYQYVMNNKKHYLGKLKKSPITGLPVMVSVYPILDENQEVIAVFGLALNLNGFSNTIIYNQENTKEETMIVDETNTVVAATDTTLIYNYNISTQLPELSQFIQQNKQGVTYFEKEGIRYLAAIKKSSADVTIIQALPVSVYWNPIMLSIMLSLIALLIVLLCVAGITFLITKNITKPIHLLVQEFETMAAGNYEGEVPTYLKKRKDEFGILGNALVFMKDKTNRLITNLNLSNEEVEASLEELLATEEELKNQNELLARREEELRESNEYSKAILSVIPDLYFILDKDGVFLNAHATADKQFYMPQEEFLGKKIDEIMPDQIAKTTCEKIKEALSTGQIQSFQYELLTNGVLEIFELRILKCMEDQVFAIGRDLTNQLHYQKQIEYLSYHDQLTGLHNRRSFEETLKKLNDENNLPLCIIMADVNGLKLVNDSFGHKAGDILLSKFAKILKEIAPSADRVFRIGGDEFVILIPDYTNAQVEVLIQKIKAACELETVNAVHLSVSLGYDFKFEQEEDLGAVLKSAEDYMYKKKLFEGPSMRGKTVSLIINTLHEKNNREEQHSRRVAELCEKLATALHMQDHQRKEIKNAGLLHDIGKIGIAENLLNKPGKLTHEEFEEVKRHPEIGYRILCSANEMSDIAEYVLSHHERWDGRGYPRGLSGEEIPLQARMIAIADTFDAMTSVRSYREPIDDKEAAKELLCHAGTQFDTKLVTCFVNEVLGYRDLGYNDFGIAE